jgi:cysteine-rich CWC protein
VHRERRSPPRKVNSAMHAQPMDPFVAQRVRDGSRPERDAVWCFSAAIAPETLERIAPEAQGVSCICARCARSLRQGQA